MSISHQLQAVRGRARERVVVVVPALAEGRDREPEDVGRVILDVEAALAEEVADRVDRPGHVVLDEDADEAAPDEAGERALPAHGQQAAEHRRDQQRRASTISGNLRLRMRMPRSSTRSLAYLRARASPCVRQSHAGVRVPEAAQRAHHAVAVTDVRRVRIALDVGVRVVLAMVGDPVDDGPLHRQHAEVREDVAGQLVRLERTMGQHPVEADGHAEPADHVHEGEDGDVGPAEPVAPQQRDRQQPSTAKGRKTAAMFTRRSRAVMA